MLDLVKYDAIGRSMYVFTPEGEKRTAYENTYLTILREDASEESALKIMELPGFKALCNEQRIVVGFPNPLEGGWNYALDPNGADDLHELRVMQDKFSSLAGMFDYGKLHPMNYAKYFVGVGTGASMLNTLAAIDPVAIAGILTVGGVMCEAALDRAVSSPVPALLADCCIDAEKYFVTASAAAQECSANGLRLYRGKVNPTQLVMALDGEKELTGELLQKAWDELFSKVRRPNTSIYGDIEPREVKKDYTYVVHIDDTCLGDNDGLGHTWFEYIPESVRENPEKKVPLMIFGHGGSDNPAEAAQMSGMHRVGEKYGFITVYPWSGEKWGWNIDMVKSMPDDVAYIKALIEYMKRTYPIDETRVYLSGFSNGSAMIQVFAMQYPELIAAICPNDTRWCQQREVLPFEIAGAKKLKYDYRMPVWYIYGGRDMEYPVVRGSGQQVQYDFWKHYNNIEIKTTPYEPDPSGVGVPGDSIEVIYPCAEHPEHRYTIHRFFTQDETPQNYYNYILMHSKGHECAPADAEMGWNFVSQFCRNPDGSIGNV